ncbi:retinol dehydrogenase 14 [Decorospora gaudefroyi]|uniref:Retinol dehydrogenase 14 n=1 Tax=Decorospora gaudefroyi TaxID=184978 RepID=A0A6A5JWV1_9PLEO|nr:retinol dehydrogenase 14 [Decorospora gaudefroyi]
MADFNFNPKTAIPDLSGKVILITGGTAGVGSGCVVELATHNPAHILFTGRNAQAAEAVIARAPQGVKLTFVPCDTASNASVASAAESILTTVADRLDVLVCCAGIMAKPAGVSKDGYEIHFATNQLGHSLFIRKLLPLLENTAALPGADARIIMVTSVAWKGTPSGGIQFDKLRSEQDLPVLGPWLRYGQSKLANLLYARELAARYPNILSFAIHPGVVKTALVTDLTWSQKMLVYLPNIGKMLTPEEGTYNLLWAITAKRETVKSGGFYMPVGKLSNDKTKASEDPELKKKLWEWTEAELAEYL